MDATAVTFRPATHCDVEAMFDLRVSVTENRLSMEQMARMGITPRSVAESFQSEARGWVAELRGQMVGFSIADRASWSIFALFVRPGFEGKGIGRELLRLASGWLWECGAVSIWLTTSQGTRAEEFYTRLGWKVVGQEKNGELRMELSRPLAMGF